MNPLPGHSIQRRLLYWMIGVLVAATAVTGAIVYRQARDEANALFDLQLRQLAAALPVRDEPRPPRSLRFSDGTRSGPEWVRVVADAVRRIESGEVAKVVLARDLRAELAEVDSNIAGTESAASWTSATETALGSVTDIVHRVRELVLSAEQPALASHLPRRRAAQRRDERGRARPLGRSA